MKYSAFYSNVESFVTLHTFITVQTSFVTTGRGALRSCKGLCRASVQPCKGFPCAQPSLCRSKGEVLHTPRPCYQAETCAGRARSKFGTLLSSHGEHRTTSTSSCATYVGPIAVSGGSPRGSGPSPPRWQGAEGSPSGEPSVPHRSLSVLRAGGEWPKPLPPLRMENASALSCLVQ